MRSYENLELPTKLNVRETYLQNSHWVISKAYKNWRHFQTNFFLGMGATNTDVKALKLDSIQF